MQSQTSTVLDIMEPVAIGLSTIIDHVTQHATRRQQEQDYRQNLTEIFQAIGTTLERYPNRMLVSDAAYHVISHIANRPDHVAPLVSFQTSLPDILDVARAYHVDADDDFKPLHDTFMDYVHIHDAYFKHVKQTMGRLNIKEKSIETFSLVQSAEFWGEHHDRQINFRASEVRGLSI